MWLWQNAWLQEQLEGGNVCLGSQFQEDFRSSWQGRQSIHLWQWVSVAAYSYHSGQEAERGRVEARQGYALKAPLPAIHFFQWFTWFLSIQACKRSEYYWVALRQAELPRRGSAQTSQGMKEAKSELPRRNDRDWAI